MRKIILGIAALGVILAAGIFLSENVSRFDAERPTPKTPALEPLAERLSRATIPVSVPIAAVGEALERRTPKRESGLKKNALGERFAQSELSWNLVRSDLQVSGRSGALSVATELSGEARAEGTFQLARKVGFSTSGDILASASLTASPTLKENWRVSPNLSETKIDIQRADIPIKRIGNLDVRKHILPGVGITTDKLCTQFNRSVAEIFGLSDAAFRRIRATHGVDKPDPYTVLRVARDISDQELKSKYRELGRAHHPDTLIAQGVPQEFIDTANEKLAVINDAYDRIERERKAV